MTGKTHRVGGMLCCLGGFTVLKANNMLLGDVSPLLQLVVMYPFAIYGSVVSDLDHNWQSSPSRDVVSYGINKTLHLTTKLRSRVREGTFLSRVLSVFDAKHRSWQTHSDLFLICMLFLTGYFLGTSASSSDNVLIKLVMLGLTMGVSSHLILDMLTPEGIWCIISSTIGRVLGLKKMPKKVSLVPNSKFFRTGGSWEDIVRFVMWGVCLMLLFSIIYDMLPYEVVVVL